MEKHKIVEKHHVVKHLPVEHMKKPEVPEEQPLAKKISTLYLSLLLVENASENLESAISAKDKMVASKEISKSVSELTKAQKYLSLAGLDKYEKYIASIIAELSKLGTEVVKTATPKELQTIQEQSLFDFVGTLGILHSYIASELSAETINIIPIEVVKPVEVPPVHPSHPKIPVHEVHPVHPSHPKIPVHEVPPHIKHIVHPPVHPSHPKIPVHEVPPHIKHIVHPPVHEVPPVKHVIPPSHPVIPPKVITQKECGDLLISNQKVSLKEVNGKCTAQLPLKIELV